MILNKVYWGDNVYVLSKFKDNSFDSIVTDPPYGIRFMNKKWDYQLPGVEFWRECLRVLKPGGHILVACGTRTHHRMTINIEDAGFEIRDTIAWVYGSGFPKNYNIGKGVDRKKGNKREIVGKAEYSVPKSDNTVGANSYGISGGSLKDGKRADRVVPTITKGNSQWEGWGTALKPAMEFFTLARKPLSEKTIVDNILKWGTGGINIDENRISISPDVDDPRQGRFPSNFIYDGSDEVLENFPYTKSGKFTKNTKINSDWGYMGGERSSKPLSNTIGDSGSAARFFYCAKASRKERGEYNNHPTVKPISLMSYLVRLITPKEGVVCDPFCGSGSTLVASKIEGIKFLGIEKSLSSVGIARRRLKDIDDMKPKNRFIQKSIFD